MFCKVLNLFGNWLIKFVGVGVGLLNSGLLGVVFMCLCRWFIVISLILGLVVRCWVSWVVVMLCEIIMWVCLFRLWLVSRVWLVCRFRVVVCVCVILCVLLCVV